MIRRKGAQFDVGQLAKTHVTSHRFNPATQGSRQGTTIRAGESIPDGWSITGTTYQNTPEGGHAGTLFHVRPETTGTLASKAHDLHDGWTPDTPAADVGPTKIFEGANPRRALR
jgi:hypothetical protein